MQLHRKSRVTRRETAFFSGAVISNAGKFPGVDFIGGQGYESGRNGIYYRRVQDESG